MIVRHFLQWVRTAPAGARAEAASALARAYLASDLAPDDRAAAESAMIMLLDDASPLVREALAQALGHSRSAPPAVVIALAGDQPQVAGVVLARSPLLLDADLIDSVAKGNPELQSAVAGRAKLASAVAAAIVEVGAVEACLVLLENPEAAIPAFSLERLVERHGHIPAIRDALLAREDLPPAMRQGLLAKLSQTLAEFVSTQGWLAPERAQKIAREACEKGTVALAAGCHRSSLQPLVSHLRRSGQLTAGLIFRILLSGNTRLFEEALAELAGFPLARVCGLVQDANGPALRALFERAGLPSSMFSALCAAVDALAEEPYAGANATGLNRRMVERVLTSCEALEDSPELEPLFMLLRRFATEAAREEARSLCHQLAA